MKKIGDYEYPTLGTFKEALDVADKAVNRYGGIIPNPVAANLIGYNVDENKVGSLGGPTYKKMEELCVYGLFTRDRGGLRATDLGKEAFDPYDTSKADAAKARAVRNIPLVAKAYDEFQGQVPEPTALPSKLVEITGVHWTEVKKHTDNLGKPFSSVFPYLKMSSGLPAVQFNREDIDKRETFVVDKGEQKLVTTINDSSGKSLYGELRTKIGSVMMTDESTIQLAISHLNVLLEQVKDKNKKKSETEDTETNSILLGTNE